MSLRKKRPSAGHHSHRKIFLVRADRLPVRADDLARVHRVSIIGAGYELRQDTVA